MHKFLYPSLYLMITFMTAANHMSDTNKLSSPVHRQDCVDTLRNAVENATNFFIKVHAAEALIGNGITEKVEEYFIAMRKTDPAFFIGSTRVLARIYKHTDKKKYHSEINTLIDQYLHADSAHPRLVALESLGKLEYHSVVKEIFKDAEQGENGFKAMARWVLSNDGKPGTEASLAALLKSGNVADYRGAAYALRFKTKVTKETVQALKKTAATLDPKELATTYVLSALFVHSDAKEKSAVKKILYRQLNGPVAARYEICEALSLNGDRSDLQQLEIFLKDEDNDVRVAAANAILKIENRSSQK